MCSFGLAARRSFVAVARFGPLQIVVAVVAVVVVVRL